MTDSSAEPLDLLAVMAHPDDAELLCGGTLIRSAQRGERVGVLDLTRGESGTWGSAGERAQEAARAAEIMGLSERRNAGLPDARLENTPAARATVAHLIRQLKPRVLITHWREGRHPDHRVAAALAYDAAYLAGLRNLEGVPSGAPAHRPLKVVEATAFREDAPAPSVVVDVADQMELKLEAIGAYRSQFGGKTAIGEVFAGGGRALLDQVRVQCAHYGSLIRAAYGEPYHVREALRVESLTDLDVATF